MADPADYRLYRSQTAVMAAIRQAVVAGYRYYLVTTTPEEKALAAVAKINARHKVLLSPEAQRVRREAGLPTARIFLAPEPKGGLWPYALLATKRLEGEQMQSAEGKRPLQWPAWRQGEWKPTYELRRDPATGRWTWFLTEAFYRELEEEGLYYAKRNDWPRLVEHLKGLSHLPLFGGVFRQITEIRRRVKDAWGDARLRSPSGKWEEPPWKRHLADWPTRALSSAVYLYVDPKVDGDRPRTLGEWFEKRGG